MQRELSTCHFIAGIGPNPAASLRASGLSMFDHLDLSVPTAVPIFAENDCDRLKFRPTYIPGRIIILRFRIPRLGYFLFRGLT